MSKRSGSSGSRVAPQGSTSSDLRRGARRFVAASAALLSLGLVGLVAPSAGASITAATGAPVSGSILVADMAANAVYSFLPGSANELAVGSVDNGVYQPAAVAVDSIGDTFIADEGTNTIDEFDHLGNESTLGIQFCQGCSFTPAGVALDGAGDLFVTDSGDGAVDEVPANTTDVNTIDSGFTPYGVASDTGGDVFVADQSANQIDEIDTHGVQSTYASLPEMPFGVAVDDSGNLFVTLPTAKEVVEIPAGPTGPGSLRTIATGVSAVSIAVDSSGNVYFPDNSTGEVWEATVNGSSYNTPVEVGSGFENPDGIAVFPPAAFAPSIVATVTGTQVYGGAITYATTISPAADASLVSGTVTCETNWMLEGVPTIVGSTPFVGCSGLSGPKGMQLVYQPGDLTVAPAPLVISPATTTMTYGTVPTIQAQYSGFQGTDGPSSLTTPPTCTTTATVTAIIGSQFPTSCSGAKDPNYSITYANGTITVAAATLTVTAPSPSITYGSTAPSLVSNITGFLNGQTASLLGLITTCSTTAPTTPSVGSYPVNCTGVSSIGNYVLNYVPGTLTVNPATLTISASSSGVTYGAAVPSVTASATFVNGDSFSKPGFTAPTCSTTYTPTSAVGSYATSCSGAVAPNYAIKYVNGAVTVGAATLSIAASSASMTYGGAVPSITPTYSGFVNGQGASSLTSLPTCTTTATSSSPAGSYTTSCSGAKAVNYTITYVPGSMTVAPAPLTVTASSATMTFGATPPVITPSYQGFVNGDTSASLTTQPSCTTAATSSSAVGTYASSCTAAKDANYTISYVAGSVKVAAATLTITASSPSVTYGSAATITPTYTGQTDGTPPASLTTAPTCTTVENKTSGVGTYSSSCTGAVDPDYTIVYVPGTVTVTPAPLTITASSASVAPGAAIPAITASYSGFQGSDTLASLTTQPTCSTTATSTSAAGSYPTSCSGAVDPNYVITYVAGTLHVGQIILTVDAPTLTKLYGQAVPTLTATITGFPSGVTLANSGITGAPVCTTVATASSPAGSYPVTCVAGTLSSTVYSFDFAPGLLTVDFSRPCVTGFYFGSLTVGAGQATCVGPNALVLGVIDVQRGGALDIEGSTVIGAISSYGASAFRVCSSSLSASISVASSTGLVTIGDPNTGCGGNQIVGAVSLTSNSGGVEFAGNTFSGTPFLYGNSGALAAPEAGSTFVTNAASSEGRGRRSW